MNGLYRDTAPLPQDGEAMISYRLRCLDVLEKVLAANGHGEHYRHVQGACRYNLDVLAIHREHQPDPDDA